MIFITLGSQKMQFNRLLKEVDRLVETGALKDEIFAQTGASDYVPKHYAFKDFIDRDEFAAKTAACNIFITHAGTGAIIGAVKKGKKVVAMPRLAKYGEHVDDHQMELITAFDKLGIIEPCYDEKDLGTAIERARTGQYKEFVSNTERMVNDIRSFLG